MPRFSILQLQRGYKHRLSGGTQRICPICKAAKPSREFRKSNQNSKTSLICWQCRHDFAGVEADFYTGKLHLGLVKNEEVGRLRGREKRVLKLRFRSVCKFLTRLRQRRLTRGKEVLWMAQDKSVELIKLPERIAAVVAKTFVVRGDDATLADDEALMRIRDLIESYDSRIVERNQNKRLFTK